MTLASSPVRALDFGPFPFLEVQLGNSREDQFVRFSWSHRGCGRDRDRHTVLGLLRTQRDRTLWVGSAERLVSGT